MDSNSRLRLITSRRSVLAEGAQCPSCFTFNVPALLKQERSNVTCPLCKHSYAIAAEGDAQAA